MAEHQMSRLPPQGPSVSQSKRALLKAGWVAPVVVVLSLPRSVLTRMPVTVAAGPFGPRVHRRLDLLHAADVL